MEEERETCQSPRLFLYLTLRESTLWVLEREAPPWQHSTQNSIPTHLASLSSGFSSKTPPSGRTSGTPRSGHVLPALPHSHTHAGRLLAGGSWVPRPRCTAHDGHSIHACWKIQEQGPVSHMTKFCPLWPHTGEQLQTAKKETQQLYSYLFTFVEWCFPYINKT